jgi:hypothetical protein
MTCDRSPSVVKSARRCTTCLLRVPPNTTCLRP